MELGKYKRALKASTRPKHLRRVVYQPEIGDTDVDFPTPDQPFNRFAGGGLVRKLFAKLKRELPVGNDTETLMQAKALTKAVEGKPMNDAEIDMLMRSSIMDDTMQRMVDDMDMSETEAYDTLVKTMQIGKPQNREGFSQGGITNRIEFSQGSDYLKANYPDLYLEIEKLKKELKGTGVRIHPDASASRTQTNRKPQIRIEVEPQYRKYAEGKKRSFTMEDLNANGLNQLKQNAFSIKENMSKEFLEKKRKSNLAAAQRMREQYSKTGRYGDRTEVKKQINQIIEEIGRGERPIYDISKLLKGELIDTKLNTVKFLQVNSRTKKPDYLTPENYKLYINKIFPKHMSIESTVRQRGDNEVTKLFKNATVKNFDALKEAYPITQYYIPKNAGEHLMQSLDRHVNAGGKKFEFVSGNNVNDFVFKEKSTGKMFSADIVNQDLNNPRWKNYVKTYQEVKDINYNTPFLDKTTGKQVTGAEAFRKLTGTKRGVPVEFDHFDKLGVYGDPINNVGVSTRTANVAANMNLPEDQLKKMFGRTKDIDLKGNKQRVVNFLQRSLVKQAQDPSFKLKKPTEIIESSKLGPVAPSQKIDVSVKPGTGFAQLDESLKNKLASIDAQTATNAVANLACPGQYADGGRVKFSRGSECYAKGLQLLDDAKFGDEKAKAKVAKGMKALKILGGVGAEILFETAFLLPSIAQGKPLDVLIGESTLGYFGLGTSEDEKTIEMSGYDPRVIRYVAAKRAYKDNQELPLKQEQMVPGLDDDFYQNMEERKKANRAVYEKFVRSNDRDVAAAANKLAEQRKQKLYDENKKGLPARTAQTILEQLNKTFIGQTEPGEVFDLAVFQDGGRVGFEDGGFTRRGFLKALGALAAVIAGLRTGKGTKVVPKTTTAKQVVENAGKGTPEWFAPLVDKIKTEGIDVPPENVMRTTSGRESVTKLEVKDPVANTTDKYFLFENPDTGEVRIDVNALGVGANDGEFSLYMRPRRVEGLTDEGIQQIDEGEFFVTEDRAVGRMSGPDDYEIDLEALDTDLSGSASNWHQLEEFATGKTDKAAQTEQLKKKDFIERNPGDDIENRYGVYDPPEPDDYD